MNFTFILASLTNTKEYGFLNIRTLKMEKKILIKSDHIVLKSLGNIVPCLGKVIKEYESKT